MTETSVERSATPKRLNTFERFLSLWVGLCMLAGVLIGKSVPDVIDQLRRMEFGAGSQINIPIAVLIRLVIIPMMMKVDFASIRNVGKKPHGLLVTLFVNWLVKPFSMAFIAWLFFRYVFAAWIPAADADQYIAGCIILAAAPCTAMVFVWSYLTEGDPAYTLVQVSINDLVMLFLFAPIVRLLVNGASSLHVPFQVLLYAVGIFIVIPLVAGSALREWFIRAHRQEWFEKTGSEQESESLPFLRRFAENQEFGFECGQPLRFQQQVAEILVSAPSSKERFDVAVDGFHHAESHRHPTVVQNPLHALEADMTPRHFNVLFLCTGNSARSIMAEAILNEKGRPNFTGYSAGSHPTGHVHPEALRQIASTDMPADGLRSKSWDEFAKPDAPKMHFVFTVCDRAASEVCPVWPGHPLTARWGVPDPAAVVGTREQVERAFFEAFTILDRRIGLFLSLPLATLEQEVIQNEIDRIGRQ